MYTTLIRTSFIKIGFQSDLFVEKIDMARIVTTTRTGQISQKEVHRTSLNTKPSQNKSWLFELFLWWENKILVCSQRMDRF